ncbi:hypothetical protein HPB49_000590 [Dermacentor silvarum]|uniref:Uncharacterized protein n=1 Tax=Dermacentor silvarum TaxID=543639 RepID=A0ACB8C0J4_DERSI|nr:hypothetical protein HPB49_000590 [Dermacentor silvarum]
MCLFIVLFRFTHKCSYVFNRLIRVREIPAGHLPSSAKAVELFKLALPLSPTAALIRPRLISTHECRQRAASGGEEERSLTAAAMAGMAWTLHPALFYEKYGAVLVQLWDSGAMGTLFRPVRRLSKTIGDALAARRSRAAEPDVQEEGASALQLTDETVPTIDEAQGRAYFVPGDTSSSLSSSEENELAFQGDVYTQMRRSRRQAERTKKIREARQQFLEGRSGSRSSKRHRRHRRPSHVVPSSVRQVLRRGLDGTGTPLTEIESAEEKPRVIIIDAASSPTPTSPTSPTSGVLTPELSEGAKEGTSYGGVGRDQALGPADLMGDNDSLRRFRAIHGRKNVTRSPPPGLVSDSTDLAADLDQGVGSGHVIVAQELLPDNDSVNNFRDMHSREKRASPTLSEDSTFQPEPMGGLHPGRPAQTISPDELLPDNDSIRKFRATHAQKASSSQSPIASAQLELQTETQPAEIQVAMGSVVRGPVPDSWDITVTEDKSMEAAGGKVQASALCEAHTLISPKDRSAHSTPIWPHDTDIQSSLPPQDEVPTLPLKAGKKKKKAANDDSGQLKKASRSKKGKSKFSLGRQKSLEYTSGLDTTGEGTLVATSGEMTRKSSVGPAECLSDGTKTQLEGQDVVAKLSPEVAETGATIKEASEMDSAMPFAGRYEELQRAHRNVRALTSGTFVMHTESEGPKRGLMVDTASQEKMKSFEPPQRAMTGTSILASEEGQKTRTTEAAALSVSAISTETNIYDSDKLEQATLTDETVGKPRKKTDSVKWGNRKVKRHKKQHERRPPVSSTFENTSRALNKARQSVRDGAATEGSAETERRSGRRGWCHSDRHSSKGHTKKDSETRFRKAKNSDKKAGTDAAVTCPGTGANAVLPDTKEDVTTTMISPPWKSSSTTRASGVASETMTRDSVLEVQVDSGQTTVSSGRLEPSASATIVTPILAIAGSSSREQPQQNAAKMQGKDPTQRSEDPSRSNNGPTFWPFRRNPSSKK